MIFPEYEYQISNTTSGSSNFDYAASFGSSGASSQFNPFSDEQVQTQPFYFGSSSLPIPTTVSTTAQTCSPSTSSPYGVVGSESEGELPQSIMSTFGQNIINEDYACEPSAKKRKSIYMPPLRENSGAYTTPESLLNGVSREALRGVPSSELEECEKYLQSTYELTQGQIDTLHKQIKLAKNREAVRKSRVKVQNKLSGFEMENVELKKKIMLLEAEIQKLRTENAVLATENNALKRKHD